jgi:hypothetical protein
MQSSSDHRFGLPDSVLTELWRVQIPPEKFAAVLSAFGQLSEEAQYDLVVRLVSAVATYRLRKTVERQEFPMPHEQRKRLRDISTSARRVLRLLGVNEPESIAGGVHIGSNLHPTATTYVLTALHRVGVQRRSKEATIDADKLLATLLMLLSDLVEAAEQSEHEISPRPGRGGDRRAGELTAEGELREAIIKVYIDFRERFPSSGPEPAFDEPLRKFVRSGLELAVSCSHSIDKDGKKIEPWDMAAVDRNLPKSTRTTDAAIRGAFHRVHKSKQNPH